VPGFASNSPGTVTNPAAICNRQRIAWAGKEKPTAALGGGLF
jgi:hypothetical protein